MMRWTSLLRSLPLIVGTLIMGLAGCSSSAPSSSPTENDESPSGPAPSLLYQTEDGNLMLHDAHQDASRTLRGNVESTGPQAVSPSGQYLALSYATTDSSHLALLDLTTQTLRRVHARAGTVTYSLAWHPDQDRLAFGFYRPTRDEGRGPGGLQRVSPGGRPRSVGCSTVREVLHWLSGNTLATRTADKLYVVSASDCATESSRDARRMHLAHYAPGGQRLAYIHRELRYDRSANEYVPDSSLVLSGPQGEDTETLFGDNRHVRHLRWSPDGSELAFDVQVQDSSHRQVVVHDGNRPVFLTSPSKTSVDQVHPRWSPDGGRLAFTLRTQSGSYAAVQMQGTTRRLGRTTGPVWGWLDERSIVVPGPDSVRIQTLDGSTRFAHRAPAALLHVWRRPPA